ncbi:MAG: mannitol dehydrogenase family protein [Beijerinckiaceae bacterium]|nr:mannitol dehydrogenase family protein [Beijerinckiaceae bacterium]
MSRLSNATLSDLPANVSRPRYDRSALKAGIVHLGVGAFHRAHQACYTEAALDAGDLRWGCIGASLRSADTRDALAAQDWLYTVAIRGSDGERYAVNGGLLGVLVAPENSAALIDAMAADDTRIVSLTITEKGYCHDPASGRLRADHPDVVHDLTHPDSPRSALGFIIRSIDARRKAGRKPYTLLSCDNLPENGRTLKRVLIDFAELHGDHTLVDHITADVPCPCTMIDRIVPATTDTDRDWTARAIGLADAWPILTEPFTQWVIEDDFSNDRPDWSLLGAQFVKDARPYEAMKLRLLNGAHSSIAYIGYLAGYQTVSEAMADPSIATFIERLMRDEIKPTLEMPPDADLDAYVAALLQRFRNPALKHRTWQIAMDGSQKLPQRLLGTIRDRLRGGQPIERLALGVAAWMRYVGGTDEKGEPIDVRDPLAEHLKLISSSDKRLEDRVRGLVSIKAVFGEDLPQNDRFGEAVLRCYTDIVHHGIRAALKGVLSL